MEGIFNKLIKELHNTSLIINDTSSAVDSLTKEEITDNYNNKIRFKACTALHNPMQMQFMHSFHY